MHRWKNKYVLLPDGRTLIYLTQGQTTLVDTDDLALLLQYRWYVRLCRSGYEVCTRMHYKAVSMPNFLLGIKGVDHKNRNPLDNRRANLRPATISQNNANRVGRGQWSVYKGVSAHRGKWRGSAGKHGRKYSSPIFDTEEEAARWYNEKALELHGEFAVLNVIPPPKDEQH